MGSASFQQVLIGNGIVHGQQIGGSGTATCVVVVLWSGDVAAVEICLRRSQILERLPIQGKAVTAAARLNRIIQHYVLKTFAVERINLIFKVTAARW